MSHDPNPTPAASQADDFWGPPIHSYSRAQAIEDGMLWDLTQSETSSLLSEFDIRIPTAMTVGAMVATVTDPDRPAEQDDGETQRNLRGVLAAFRLAAVRHRHVKTDRFNFTAPTRERHAPAARLWAQIGPGDNGEPVLTIMLQGED